MNTPPICNYEGSDYQTSFWDQGGRAYEDAVEEKALKKLLPESGQLMLELGAGAGRNTPRYKNYEKIVLLDYSRTQLEQARNTYQASSSDAEEFRIRSTIYGKVYALYKEPGEAVLPNEPLAMLGSAETFLAEMLVDEVDIVRLKTGQQVLITLDAYADRLFEAKVSKIYPEKDTRNQTFLVEARFANPPEVLYPGLSGEANIVIATRQDALTIPRSYLVGTDSVRTTAGMVKVETGLITLDRVEIRSGLQPGTRLLKPEE